jgi:hypothetical protein
LGRVKSWLTTQIYLQRAVADAICQGRGFIKLWQQPNDRANAYNQRKNNTYNGKRHNKAIIKELTDRLLLV